jgi:hypothetical protein
VKRSNAFCRKKLRADAEQQFPSLSSAQVATLVPNKGDMTLLKIATHSDEVFNVYCYEKNPVFFEAFKKLYPSGKKLYPSGSAIWMRVNQGYIF